jgi:uncharacterized protein (DUF1697 family)
MNKKLVGLLRGINVGGRNKLRMVDLRELCDSIGFSNVSTYIQSGNLVLRSDLSPKEVSSMLKIAIKDAFDIETSVLMIDGQEFIKIAEAYPFDVKNHKEAHIMFLAGKPAPEVFDTLKKLDFGNDKMKLTSKALYLHLPNGVAEASISFPKLERALGVMATARNTRTVDKLIKMINSPKT